MPHSSHVTDELQRARALLSPRRVSTQLTEVAANPSPESIGAQGGVGFKADQSGVTFNVYVFEDWDQSNSAVDAFDRQHQSDNNVYVATTMNGPLVFYGFVRTDARDGTEKQFQLAEFMSAFAGDE